MASSRQVVSAEEYLDMQAKAMSEDDLLGNVRELAHRLGWLCYHTHDSRRSDPGFPDLTLVRGSRLVFIELKSQKGRYRAGQENWLFALSQCAEAYTYRPVDWLDGTIRECLSRHVPMD